MFSTDNEEEKEGDHDEDGGGDLVKLKDSPCWRNHDDKEDDGDGEDDDDGNDENFSHLC